MNYDNHDIPQFSAAWHWSLPLAESVICIMESELHALNFKTLYFYTSKVVLGQVYWLDKGKQIIWTVTTQAV